MGTLDAKLHAPSSVQTAVHAAAAKPAHKAARKSSSITTAIGDKVAALMSKASKAEAKAKALEQTARQLEELSKAQGEIKIKSASHFAHAIPHTIAKFAVAPKVQTTGLKGKYISKCAPGRDCVKHFHTGDMESYNAENHTVMVSANGIGLPMGPAVCE